MFPHAKLVEKDIHDVFTRNNQQDPHWRDGYHSFDSVQADLNSLVQAHPELASLETYGTSDAGQPLLALRLTGIALVANKPEVMITASTHGNEIATVEVVMAAIDQLAKGYGKDTRITQMLDKHVLFFIPVVSPDGYLNESREVHGVDRRIASTPVPGTVPPAKNLDEANAFRQTRRRLRRRSWLMALAIFFSLAPFSFFVSDTGQTWWLLRDQPQYAAYYAALGVVFWILYAVERNRSRGF